MSDAAGARRLKGARFHPSARGRDVYPAAGGRRGDQNRAASEGRFHAWLRCLSQRSQRVLHPAESRRFGCGPGTGSPSRAVRPRDDLEEVAVWLAEERPGLSGVGPPPVTSSSQAARLSGRQSVRRRTRKPDAATETTRIPAHQASASQASLPADQVHTTGDPLDAGGLSKPLHDLRIT